MTLPNYYSFSHLKQLVKVLPIFTQAIVFKANFSIGVSYKQR